VGVDASPLATLIARVKTKPLSAGTALQALEQLEEIRRVAPTLTDNTIRNQFLDFDVPVPPPGYRGRPRGISFWFEEHVLTEIAGLAHLIAQVRDQDIRNLLRVGLSAITIQVSKQDSDTRYVRRDKNVQPGETLKKFHKKSAHIIAAVSALDTQGSSSSIVCADSRNLSFLEPETFDLVVTSPPYPNAWSYHLYHQNRMLVLGLNPWTFKAVEIGCHRDYSAKNGATKETFFEDMDACLSGLHAALKPDAFCCVVVGPSIVRGELVDNAEVIRSAGVSIGFRHVSHITRAIDGRKKAFNPSIGKIKSETIVVLRKP
jgi:site-specific DNA-methyltransferase (cytosine-N4-specific)